jgi:VWFA-related protein
MPALRSFVRAVFLFSVVAGLSLPARSQNANPATATLRVASNLVFLDLTVIDRKGKPVVTGLTKGDFTITENGKPQRIFSFDAPVTGAKTAEGAPATILVLDLMNTTSADSAYARDSIRRYLALQPQRLPSPTELMVLNNTTLDLVQAYTRSRGDLVVALNHVPPAKPYKLGSQEFGSEAWLGQRLSQSIEALQQIALQNEGLPGRKNILWVGYGGPGIGIDPADPRYDKELRFYAHGTTNMLVDARISLFLIRPGLQGAGNPDVLRLEGESGQAGAELYGVDPFAETINFGLFINGTGGRLFSQRNDDDIAMTEAQELGSNYYTLTYQPKTGEDNGEFRKIEVVLRDPNLRAVTKTGYYAPESTMKTDSTPYSVDPMYEIEEAAQSEVPFDSLGLSLVHVARHPDSETVELTTLLKSTHLHWQATDDGRSAADITIAAVSLSKQRGILASRLRRLTIFSNSQDPARLSSSNTLVTITVPVPRRTESVRVIILAQDGGQTGAVELEHKVLASVPGSPTPEPQLQQRPGVTSQLRP